ncbi:hypothetical protein LIER_16171 [Lithospermum erythrorhizon]|uniref:Uncharacterized protein n=1 Tax=Lithospermum erythrorhizon TaxID=34254 RepID=A0AAV3Q738_LITER
MQDNWSMRGSLIYASDVVCLNILSSIVQSCQKGQTQEEPTCMICGLGAPWIYHGLNLFLMLKGEVKVVPRLSWPGKNGASDENIYRFEPEGESFSTSTSWFSPIGVTIGPEMVEERGSGEAGESAADQLAAENMENMRKSSMAVSNNKDTLNSNMELINDGAIVEVTAGRHAFEKNLMRDMLV